MKKKLTVVAALVLVLAMGVGGTLAYLTDKTAAVTNTFTVGNVKIELTEAAGGTNHEFKMIPGNEIEKDPKVTVTKGSEDCWLFVKLDEAVTASVSDGNNGTKALQFSDFISYKVLDGWTALDGKTGVYYRKVTADNTKDQPFEVIGYEKDANTTVENKVLVNSGVTQDMMEALNNTGAQKPTLTITAYAVQQANVNTAADAWDILFLSAESTI